MMQEQEWQSYVDGAFSRMDLDGDGYIDLDELLSELPPAYFQVGGWVADMSVFMRWCAWGLR
jgi:Ca2+-binding EF-hand superfamily protein